jgi:signal peptidase II
MADDDKDEKDEKDEKDDKDDKDGKDGKDDKPTAPPTPLVVDKRWKIFGIVALVNLVADQATKIWSRSALADTVHPIRGSEPCSIPYDLIPSIAMKTQGGGEHLFARCDSTSVKFLGDFWSWKLSMNTGSAFGLFGSSPGAARVFLSIVGLVAVAGMIYMLRKCRADQRILQWALAFVAGGAVGNLIDRIYFGAVTDMVSWDLKFMRWPTFNVADVSLVIGVGLMFIDIQKEGKREKAEKKRKKEAREARKKKLKEAASKE